MAWPLSQDYNEALQNPQSSFRDPQLRQGRAAVNALGIPQPCSGNFADVYAVECPATRGKWAVKCFTRQVHGLRERYSEISKYLQQIRLPFTVDFQYLDEGIRIAGRWYPVLKMHWVEGWTLNAFVRARLDKPAKLEAMGRIWLRMAQRLRDANLTHCDLQHGNVLLVPDNEAQSLAVKLIDYDGMWVPALTNTPSGEVGHPAYQHPRRLREGIYNAEVDRFPLLAIYVALRALAVGGRQLWQRYDSGDNLLFRQADYEAPARSPLFAELLRTSQAELRELVIKLIDAARMPLEQTPHLTDVVAVETPPASESGRLAPRVGMPSRSNGATPRRASASDSPSVSQPVADAAPQEYAPILRVPRRPRRSKGALLWMSGIVLAMLGGGGLLWGLLWGGASENPSPKPVLAPAKGTVTTEAVEDKIPPTLEEKQPPAQVDDNEPAPHGSPKADNPSRPTEKPTSAPAETKPPRPTESPKPSNPPPPSPKPDKTPPKPAQTRQPIPDGPPGSGKFPIPDEASLKASTEEIRDTYKAAYESKDATEMVSLAEKLLKRGLKASETTERRFVFLREASTVAAKGGDVILSLRALDELGKLFAVELLSMKTAALQETVKHLRTLDTSKTLLESIFSLLFEAIQANDYENAEHLVKSAEKAAFKSGVRRSTIQADVKKVQRLKTKYAAIQPALATLAAQPNDQAANGIVGTFRCFEKGDWENGLPLLARSDDAQLKALAAKDLAAPTTADARVAVGDSWWTLAQQRMKGPEKSNIQQRACYWYERALPDAVDKTRIRMEKHIRQHNRDHPHLAWGDLDISQAIVTLGASRLPKGNKAIVTRASYTGPLEITALACTEKNNIRLRAGKGACVIFNWENKREELRVTRPDGTDRPESGSLATAVVKPLQPNIWYLLSWRITEEGMTVSINGRVVFSEEHKNDLSEKHPVSVNSVDSDLEVLSFTVRPIGKKSD